MAPEARSKLGGPCSNIRSFRSKCTVLKGVLASDLAPGELCSPRYAPAHEWLNKTTDARIAEQTQYDVSFTIPQLGKGGDFKLRPAANTARVPRTFAEQLRIIISLDLTRPPRLMRPWTVVDARFCLVLHFMSAVALKLRRWSHRRVDVTTAMVQVRDQNDPKKIEKYEMQNI